MSVALANGGTKERRRELDFYPTPPEVTKALMIALDLAPMTIWEPACGDGAMATVIESYGHTVIASDLRHTGFGVGGIDFLASKMRCEAIITNPPFAQAEGFIRKATEEVGLVAMLLKSQYWHAKSRYGLFNGCPPSLVMPLTWRPDFMNGERGGAPTMDCIWTVWDRRRTGPTVYQPVQRPSRQESLL